jgi:hypothetical protein
LTSATLYDLFPSLIMPMNEFMRVWKFNCDMTGRAARLVCGPTTLSAPALCTNCAGAIDATHEITTVRIREAIIVFGKMR